MATANSTAQLSGEVHPIRNHAYAADSSAEFTGLFSLLRAVGHLQRIGYTAEGENLAYVWGTDQKSLEYLTNHANQARKAIESGIAGIGELLWMAGANEKNELSRDALRGIGELLHQLGDALQPLDELEYGFRDGKPSNRAKP